jgi:hypothetical protein
MVGVQGSRTAKNLTVCAPDMQRGSRYCTCMWAMYSTLTAAVSISNSSTATSITDQVNLPGKNCTSAEVGRSFIQGKHSKDKASQALGQPTQRHWRTSRTTLNVSSSACLVLSTSPVGCSHDTKLTILMGNCTGWPCQWQSCSTTYNAASPLNPLLLISLMIPARIHPGQPCLHDAHSLLLASSLIPLLPSRRCTYIS